MKDFGAQCRSRWTSGLALCGFSLLTGCATLPPESTLPLDQVPLEEPDRAKARALAAFGRALLSEHNRDFEQAAHGYAKAVSYDPTHRRTHLRAALNLIRLQRGEEAIQLLSGLALRYPREVESKIWLGSAYRHAGLHDEALKIYQQALHLAPTNEAIYVQIVDLMTSRGDALQAVDFLEAGISQVSEPLPLYRMLGELYLRMAFVSTEEAAVEHYTQQALRTLEDALQRYPDEYALWFSYSELQLRRRQWEDALAGFERLHVLESDNLEVKRRLIALYERLNRRADAILILEDIARLQPTNPQNFLVLGAMYEMVEDLERAILNYHLAARLDDSDPAAHLKLAVLLLEQDQPERAVSALMQGLIQQPGNPRLLEMLAFMHFNQGRYAEAREAFQSTQLVRDQEEGPLTPNFHLYHALSLYFTDRPAQAADALRLAKQGNADAPTLFMHTVFSDENPERISTLIPILEQVWQETNQPDVLLTLAYAHSFLRQYEQALTLFDQVMASDADHLLTSRFYFWFGAAQERTGNNDRAADLFYQSIAIEPNHPEAYNYLAYMWAEQGLNLEKAETYVLIALEAQPHSGAFIDTLGWIYYQQGRYEEAYVKIRRALELIPDDATILDHLGDIYWQLGNEEEAATAWLSAFRADPENDDLRAKLEEHGLLPLRSQEEGMEDVTEPPPSSESALY